MLGIAKLYGQFVAMAGAVQRFILQSTVFQAIAHQGTFQSLTFGASVTIELANGTDCLLVQTSNAAHTVQNPTIGGAALTGALLLAMAGMPLRIVFRNTSGGAAGVTSFGTLYKVQGGAWTNAATANQRVLNLVCDGVNFVEVGRSAADVPN